MLKKNVFACLALLLSMQLMAQNGRQNIASRPPAVTRNADQSFSSRPLSVNPSWYLPGSQYLPSPGRVQCKDPETVQLYYGLSTPGLNWWGVVFTNVNDPSQVISLEMSSPNRDGFGGGELVKLPIGTYNVRFEYLWPWDFPHGNFYFWAGCQGGDARHEIGYEMTNVYIGPGYDCDVMVSD